MRKAHRKMEGEVGVELKYCEHCGGLWVRERGTGEVYCDTCRPKVADLPAPKKKPGRITLPVGQRVLMEKYEDEETNDLEAAGGVA